MSLLLTASFQEFSVDAPVIVTISLSVPIVWLLTHSAQHKTWPGSVSKYNQSGVQVVKLDLALPILVSHFDSLSTLTVVFSHACYKLSVWSALQSTNSVFINIINITSCYFSILALLLVHCI